MSAWQFVRTLPLSEQFFWFAIAVVLVVFVLLMLVSLVPDARAVHEDLFPEERAR